MARDVDRREDERAAVGAVYSFICPIYSGYLSLYFCEAAGIGPGWMAKGEKEKGKKKKEKKKKKKKRGKKKRGKEIEMEM
jgi:hypothetical protein